MKKNKKQSKKEEWMNFYKNLIRVELDTDAGKINFRFGIALVVLCLILAVKDWIMELANISIILMGKEVPKESVNITLMFISIVCFFILCILMLLISDNKKKKIFEESEKQ
jgi:hypothetical protein